MSKEANSMAALSKLFSLFVNISIDLWSFVLSSNDLLNDLSECVMA